MKYLIATSLLFVSIVLTANAQGKPYPSYREVLDKFYTTYSIESLPNSSFLQFQKRPSGWHVAVIEYANGKKEVKNELLWSSANGKFAEIDFEELKPEENNETSLNQALNDGSERFYKINAFYGYPGWEMDLIKFLEKKDELSDSSLYALGRAYSSAASDLLNDNSGLSDVSTRFQLSNGKNSLTSEQLAQYRQYGHKAIDAFKKLNDRNPDFQTIVGAIGTKLSNQYITMFMELWMFQNEEEAEKELVDGLYDDFTIAAAKNYLSSCDSNAILFANGDNDTYPLLYVQAKKHFRRDVLVVNLSLLNTDRYINSLRERVFDANPFPMSFTPEQIEGSKRLQIVLTKKIQDEVELDEMIKRLHSDDYMMNYGNMSFHNLPTSHGRLSVGDDTLRFTLPGSYFTKNHLMVLDMLALNKWKRPVYYAATVDPNQMFGFENNLSLVGFAYQLVSEADDDKDKRLGRVNSDALYHSLMKVFDWSGRENMKPYKNTFVTNYLSIFGRLANELMNQGRPDSAIQVLDRYFELFPDQILPFNPYDIELLRVYYESGAYEKGNAVARVLCDNLKGGRALEITGTTELKDVGLQALRNMFEYHELTEMLEYLDK